MPDRPSRQLAHCALVNDIDVVLLEVPLGFEVSVTDSAHGFRGGVRFGPAEGARAWQTFSWLSFSEHTDPADAL